MSLTKRQFLGYGAAGLAGLAAIAYGLGAFSGDPGWTSTFMTVDEMKASGGHIVDIRTPPEWAETGVIEGAQLVTFTDPARFLAKVGPQIADGRDLILICRSGNRSSRAARALAGKIPNRIISIDGGMMREIASGYRTVPPS